MHSSSLFFREFFKTFHTTGAILPSGSVLARALAAPLGQLSGPRHILEAGPGTGAVTRFLVSDLQPGDELTLCEINPEFAGFLKEKIDTIWKDKKSQIHLVQADVLQVLQPTSFDLIVSGLPLNNFDPSFVREVLNGYLQALRPKGIHTFFEYIALRPIRIRFARPAERARLTEVDKAVFSTLEEHHWSRRPIWRNIPPAWVYQVKTSISS
jgi:phospholipid N-methyltransferase